MTKQKWRTRGGDSSATVDIPSYYGWQIEEVCRDEVASSSPHQSMNASLSTCLFAFQPGPIADKFSSLPLRLKKVIIRRQLFWILLRSHHLHSESTHTYPRYLYARNCICGIQITLREALDLDHLIKLQTTFTMPFETL